MIGLNVLAQVGINNIAPNASLDITATDQTNPANTDGILIPRIDQFPTVNPGTAQNGMLVYLTTTDGTNPPGFYYWNNGTSTWQNVSSSDDQTIESFSFDTSTNVLSLAIENDGLAVQTTNLSTLADKNTLDESYDQGGAGVGRTITADNGALTVAGSDGLVVTGNFNSGETISVSGSGDRMFFNPRKAAFRAGTVGSGGIWDSSAWDDANIGARSFGVNAGTIASGSYSFAANVATVASGYASSSFGNQTQATGSNEMAIGSFNSTGTSRYFVVGNGTTDTSRSDAFEVYSDGRVTINDSYTLPTADGSSGQVLQTNGAGTLSWANSSVSATNGLSTISSSVGLGGTLTQNSTITQGFYDLEFNLNSSGSFIISDSGIDHFEMDGNGNMYVGGDTYWRNSTTSGTNVGRLYSSSGSGVLDLFTSGSTNTRISSTGTSFFNGGNVGIGTFGPNEVLDVEGIDASGFIAEIYNRSTSTSADGLAIRIGNTSVSTNNYFIGFYTSGTTIRGRVTGNGLGGLLYSTTSDARLKTNFKNVDGALAMISRMNPQWYEYKNHLGYQEMGFLAQELQKVYPNAVAGSPDSDPKTEPMMVDYAKITPLLTAGIQELQQKVNTLEDNVADLEAENTALKATVAKYEALEARIAALEGDKSAATQDIVAQNEE